MLGARKNIRVKVFRPVLLVLLCLPLEAATGQTPEQQLEQYFRGGQEALQHSEFARAAEDFKKVLALDPALVEAEVNLGLAYQGLLEYDLAVRYLAKALQERPNLPGPALIVGLDYLRLGTPEKAIPFLEQSVKLDPSNRYPREALASYYLSRENFRNAADQFRQIALQNPDKADGWFKLGHEYLDLAARLAYRGAHLYPESAWGHRFLGDLLFQRDRWKEAIDEYQKALASEPQQPGLHTSIAYAYLHMQKLEEAETEFRREIELGSKNDLQLHSGDQLGWLGLANLQLLRSQPAAALESLRKLWEISPEFLAVQRDFPSIELPQDVAKASISGLGDAPDRAAKHFLLAGLFTATNEGALAEREWKAFQSDFSAWQQTSNAVAGGQTVQDPCTAHRYSRCIVSLQARRHLTDSERLLLGRAYFTLQQYEPAADALTQVHGTAAENAETSYWLERTYQAQGAEAYARLEESFPDSWRTHQLLAEGYALRADLRYALQEFQAALELGPNEPELHEALGELYLEHLEYDAAQSELEKALALDSSRTHALYLLGRAYVEEKETEKALPYLERAVRLQPDLAEANSLLGTAYLRLGQFANAISSLEKAAGSDHYGNVHYQLSVAYRKLGQPERAQKELMRSQDLRRSYLERDQALIMGSARPAPESQ